MRLDEFIKKLQVIAEEEGVGLEVEVYDDDSDEVFTVDGTEVNSDGSLPVCLITVTKASDAF